MKIVCFIKKKLANPPPFDCKSTSPSLSDKKISARVYHPRRQILFKAYFVYSECLVVFSFYPAAYRLQEDLRSQRDIPFEKAFNELFAPFEPHRNHIPEIFILHNLLLLVSIELIITQKTLDNQYISHRFTAYDNMAYREKHGEDYQRKVQ